MRGVRHAWRVGARDRGSRAATHLFGRVAEPPVPSGRPDETDRADRPASARAAADSAAGDHRDRLVDQSQEGLDAGFEVGFGCVSSLQCERPLVELANIITDGMTRLISTASCSGPEERCHSVTQAKLPALATSPEFLYRGQAG